MRGDYCMTMRKKWIAFIKKVSYEFVELIGIKCDNFIPNPGNIPHRDCTEDTMDKQAK